MIAFFGGNFTGLSQELQISYLAIAQSYLRNDRIKGIRISTRPDYISELTLALLKQYGVTHIELGAQSFDDKVLQLSQRGHTATQTEKASEMILGRGFNLGLQMMIGLPGDSKSKAINTAKKIIELGASETRIYPALVLENTALARMYRENRFQPLSLAETTDWLKTLLPLFENAGVKILRVGLHPSDELDDKNTVLAGPYHPSLKELARSSTGLDKLKTLLLNKAPGTYCIGVHPSEINHIIGYRSENRPAFKALGYQLQFIQDEKYNKLQIL